MVIHRWLYVILALALVLIALLFLRVHGAAAAAIPKGDVEAGRLSAQAVCSECHSVEPETAGTGKFAPDFTVIAGRRSARWLRTFLDRQHVRMPNLEFDGSFKDDLVAYVMSLRRRH
ncbi:cytochrome c552 [Rhodoplanes sp. Z2-YC6860]|nr:cytochrome c552 [Rhodoplanes sp. Z2-YC6860]